LHGVTPDLPVAPLRLGLTAALLIVAWRGVCATLALPTPSHALRRPRRPRQFITVDMPPDQVAWLDAQAKANLCSRSAFVRQLIQRLMAET
jgi:hypothetical protein